MQIELLQPELDQKPSGGLGLSSVPVPLVPVGTKKVTVPAFLQYQ